MYTAAWCGFCGGAKELLARKGIPYEEIDVARDPAFRQRLFELTGGWTVPQILIDGQTIGGYRELRRLEHEGRLDRLVGAPSTASSPDAAAGS
jgi:glutaredoxin 3